jgi:hypothetical protein
MTRFELDTADSKYKQTIAQIFKAKPTPAMQNLDPRGRDQEDQGRLREVMLWPPIRCLISENASNAFPCRPCDQRPRRLAQGEPDTRPVMLGLAGEERGRLPVVATAGVAVRAAEKHLGA